MTLKMDQVATASLSTGWRTAAEEPIALLSASGTITRTANTYTVTLPVSGTAWNTGVQVAIPIYDYAGNEITTSILSGAASGATKLQGQIKFMEVTRPATASGVFIACGITFGTTALRQVLGNIIQYTSRESGVFSGTATTFAAAYAAADLTPTGSIITSNSWGGLDVTQIGINSAGIVNNRNTVNFGSTGVINARPYLYIGAFRTGASLGSVSGVFQIDYNMWVASATGIT